MSYRNPKSVHWPTTTEILKECIPKVLLFVLIGYPLSLCMASMFDVVVLVIGLSFLAWFTMFGYKYLIGPPKNSE